MKQCLVIFVQLYLTNKQIEYFWKVWIGLHIIQTFYDLLPLVFKIMWGSWRSAWKRGTILFSYKILFLYFTSKKKIFIFIQNPKVSSILVPWDWEFVTLQCFDHPNILGPPLEYPKGTNGSVRESSKSRLLSPGAHEMTKKSLSRDSLGILFLIKN